jgi:octaprenyl-diphosphate synthase
MANSENDAVTAENVRRMMGESEFFLADGLAATERKIAELLGADLPFITEVLRYAAGSGGKRFRPRLTLLSAATGGLDQAQVAGLAACMECIHLATLLHDDVIDEATMRRGRPTTHRRFGNNLSILGGDYILTRVFQYLVNEVKNWNILDVAVATTNRMVAGEFFEMWRQGRLDFAEEDYVKMITLKSAKLLEASCQVGALAAGYDGREYGAFTEYGLNTGISFQITDDCLDLAGDGDSLGKEGFADVRSGKITLPVIYGLASARGRDVTNAVEAIWEGEQAEDELVRALKEGGAFEKSRASARAYAEKGKGALAGVPGGEARDFLTAIADWTWCRQY